MAKKKIEKVEFKTSAERKAYVKKAMQEMNKAYGIDVIHYGKDEKDWDKIPTGIKEIDELLGGGFACGRFSTIWGSKGSAKTSIALSTVAQAQKMGKEVLYIALEPFDIERAKLFGVDINNLMVARFPIAEQSLDTIIKMSRQKLVDLIVLDSIHSLSPKSEQEDKKGEKSVEADTMALLARKLSQFFRMAVDPVYRGNVCVLLIGQTRTSIGFIAFEQLTGGNSLKHNSKLILHIRRGQKADSPTEKIKIKKIDEKVKTRTEIIGFDCVIKIDHTQTPGTKRELSEIHLPYYFENGFNKPKPKEIIESTIVNEPVTSESIDKNLENIAKLEGQKEAKPKKKRGRPKKEK